MPYWSGDLHGNDFAFDSVGVIVLQTVKRLEKEANLVIEKQHPEQSMLALLKILDTLMDEFPKSVSVHFRKRRYLSIKEKYTSWHKNCARVPKKHAAEFDENAKSLFGKLDRKLNIESLDDASEN